MTTHGSGATHQGAQIHLLPRGGERLQSLSRNPIAGDRLYIEFVCGPAA
jgi:hypothetical protein